MTSEKIRGVGRWLARCIENYPLTVEDIACLEEIQRMRIASRWTDPGMEARLGLPQQRGSTPWPRS
jgi:hypothetical protein